MCTRLVPELPLWPVLERLKGNAGSKIPWLEFGVPQGSMLRSVLFTNVLLSRFKKS